MPPSVIKLVPVKTAPWDETKDESQKVYLVLGLEVMGQVQWRYWESYRARGRCYGSLHNRWKWFMGLLVRS